MRTQRVMAPYGSNIEFIAKYLFDNPGARSIDCRKALCKNNGVFWSSPIKMRGQYTSYFNSGRMINWFNNPCGRYWRRILRPDGKRGYLLTLEGLCKSKK